MSTLALGIDFGSTTVSAAAIAPDGRLAMVDSPTPALVHFGRDGSTEVGVAGDPERTVHRVRDHLGDDTWSFDVDGVAFGATDIAAILLQAIVPANVTGAVVTVPTYFHDGQRAAMRDAVASAGAPLLQMTNAPTAAAFAYATIADLRGTVLVHDTSAGLLDVSVLNIDSPNAIGLLSTNGTDDPAEGEKTIRRAMKDAGAKVLDGVIVVGDATVDGTVHAIAHAIVDCPILSEIDPTEVVARGAAIQAAIIDEQRRAAA